MTDDDVIEIRRFLAEAPVGESAERHDQSAFAVWGGGGERSRFALPLWRAIYLVGGDWGGIVSLSGAGSLEVMRPLFILDLKRDPARTDGSPVALRLLQGEDAPALVFTDEGELAVLLGTDGDQRWFLQVRGGRKGVQGERKARETILFLAGECAGLLFFRELATPLPSSSSAP